MATPAHWTPGRAPVSVVLITLNEAHNLPEFLDHLRDFAGEVIIVDSYSSDRTVDIALDAGVRIVQRRFRGYGDQWNFALTRTGIRFPWTMKLDPDERLTPDLKAEIRDRIARDDADGFTIDIKLWFLGRELPVRQNALRLWRTGSCTFSDVLVNEYAKVDGRVDRLVNHIEHHDSPSLHHWFDKQNRYTTGEAELAFKGQTLAFEPKLFGSGKERRMWLKRAFYRTPFRYQIFFLYNWLWLGAWRAGTAGRTWARLRSDVMRYVEYKLYEMHQQGRVPPRIERQPGSPDPRVPQLD